MADDLDTLVGFTYVLRDAGVPVGTERVMAYCRAAASLDPSDPVDLYWTGRTTLIANREDLPAYDRAFSAYFAGASEGPEPSGPPKPLLRVAPQAEGEDRETPPDDDEPDDGGVARAKASRTELLREKAFDEQTPAERAATEELIARLAVHVPRRRSRRTRPARRGHTPDLVRMLRRSLRTYGEPVERVWRGRRTRPRRLVLLFDVSGSMEAYTRPLVRFAHAAAHSGAAVEAFTFGTQLTRITRALRHRDPAPALDAVGPLVPDWHGGTRIGDSIWELLRDRDRRGLLRGSVVVICSDGLDRGDPESLRGAMRRLRLLSHRIVWVNPLKGSPDYEPLARGMAAALPYLDDFLSGHNLASLESLVGILEEAA